MGGDEFCVIIIGSNKSNIDNCIADLYNKINKYNSSNEVKLSLSIGTSISNESDKNIYDLLSRCDSILYKNKKEYYKVK